MGDAYRGLGQHSNALTCYNNGQVIFYGRPLEQRLNNNIVIREEPGSLDLKLKVAECLEELGDKAEALRLVKEGT